MIRLQPILLNEYEPQLAVHYHHDPQGLRMYLFSKSPGHSRASANSLDVFENAENTRHSNMVSNILQASARSDLIKGRKEATRRTVLRQFLKLQDIVCTPQLAARLGAGK